ncbi:DUF7676 family protein [Zavarzinia sp. CC-PAN008]|uniref:DUF7676 family protein n=1 Tax=Zavarzinia sp. CC-PAN008 TaxID=3243332 RepID=UPI003F746420
MTHEHVAEHRVVRNADGRITEDVWPLSLDPAVLERFFRTLFGEHHDKVTFGPLIQGGAYELRCPGAPQRITVTDGYLTVHWGRFGHFHLCIGPNLGPASNPTPPELIAQRRPSRAEMFRGRDRREAPVTWGFRMENGHGEQQITLFFPNPFITDEDGVADAPDWPRLALWHRTLRDFAGVEPDGLDQTSLGFK